MSYPQPRGRAEIWESAPESARISIPSGTVSSGTTLPGSSVMRRFRHLGEFDVADREGGLWAKAATAASSMPITQKAGVLITITPCINQFRTIVTS